jgi:hypothetical protein
MPITSFSKIVEAQMPRFDVAHIREQGVDLVIIPLDRSFGHKSGDDKDSIVSELQARATTAV